MTGKNRRKNKHPKRAENVKTVVVVRKGGDREEEGEDDERGAIAEDAHVHAVVTMCGTEIR